MHALDVHVPQNYSSGHGKVPVPFPFNGARTVQTVITLIRSTVRERLLTQHFFATQWSAAALREQTNAAAMAITLALSSYLLHPRS